MKASIILFVVLSLSGVAVAQDKPYSPKPADWSSLLTPASYVESPLELEFPKIETRRVVNGARIDFEDVYDVDYTQLIIYLDNAYKNQTPVAVFRAGAIPYSNAKEAIVIGVQAGNSVKYTIGSRDLPLRFTIEVRPDKNHTIVTLQNAISSQLYSGLMPARAGYKPKDSTKQIPFRWN